MSDEHPLQILLVDDEDIVHQTLIPYLTDSGHKVTNAREGETAVKLIGANDYDLALIDIRMPGMDGFTLLEKIGAIRPDLSVVMITGHASMEIAIKALRMGAADFLPKPVKLLELDAVLEKSKRLRELRQEKRRLKETVANIQAFEDAQTRNRRLVGRSASIEEARKQIQMATDANCDTIMIYGETGTGKEVVAREIHFMSGKDDNPFIAVSCPAIPETLIESELFGHVRGAFTGATEDKPGCFELADGGTLFLDEVADLSAGAQAKLLRVLETRSLRRVGGSKEISVNLRVIAATNVNLSDSVKSGKFRQDLFYRLNVFSIILKPLRERREDIMPLAEHFLTICSKKCGLKIGGFSREAQDALLKYDFPGNARELRNMVERAAIISRSRQIEAHHLNIAECAPQTGSQHAVSGEDAEKGRIISALEEAKWNRREAAKILGISYSSLRYKLKKYGME